MKFNEEGVKLTDTFYVTTDTGAFKMSTTPVEVGTTEITFGGHNWLVVDKTDTITTLMATDFKDKMEFDAPEPSNPDTNRSKQGNNCWRDSNVRQWLNSDKAAGEWFTPATEYDVAPSYSNLAGFLNGFTAEEKAKIIPKDNVTLLSQADGEGSETTTDMVWIPSATELIGTTYNNISEGNQLEYFKDIEHRKGSVFRFARSPYVNSPCGMWGVNADGTTDCTGASVTCGVCPCIQISTVDVQEILNPDNEYSRLSYYDTGRINKDRRKNKMVFNEKLAEKYECGNISFHNYVHRIMTNYGHCMLIDDDNLMNSFTKCWSRLNDSLMDLIRNCAEYSDFNRGLKQLINRVVKPPINMIQKIVCSEIDRFMNDSHARFAMMYRDLEKYLLEYRTGARTLVDGLPDMIDAIADSHGRRIIPCNSSPKYDYETRDVLIKCLIEYHAGVVKVIDYIDENSNKYDTGTELMPVSTRLFNCHISDMKTALKCLEQDLLLKLFGWDHEPHDWDHDLDIDVALDKMPDFRYVRYENLIHKLTGIPVIFSSVEPIILLDIMRNMRAVSSFLSFDGSRVHPKHEIVRIGGKTCIWLPDAPLIGAIDRRLNTYEIYVTGNGNYEARKFETHRPKSSIGYRGCIFAANTIPPKFSPDDVVHTGEYMSLSDFLYRCVNTEQENTPDESESIDDTNQEILNKSFKTIQFGGRLWFVWIETKSKLYLRTVESIGKLQWDSKEGRNWGECDLRKYLNEEFYESLPEEDRKRIIPVRNITGARTLGKLEETWDKVWLNSVGDTYDLIAAGCDGSTWLRDPFVGSAYDVWCVSAGRRFGSLSYNTHETCPSVCIRK